MYINSTSVNNRICNSLYIENYGKNGKNIKSQGDKNVIEVNNFTDTGFGIDALFTQHEHMNRDISVSNDIQISSDNDNDNLKYSDKHINDNLDISNFLSETQIDDISKLKGKINTPLYYQDIMTQYTDHEDELDINSLKFSKPRVRIENTSHSSYEDLNELTLVKDLINFLDDTFSDKEYTKYMEDSFTKSKERGKEKMRTKTHKIKLNKTKVDKTSENFVHFHSNTIKPIETNNIKIEFKNSSTAFRLVQTDVKGKIFHSLIDTGASHCVMNYSLAKSLDLNIRPIKIKLCTVNGDDSSNTVGIAKLPFIIRDKDDRKILIEHEVLICQNTNNHAMIIGADLLFSHKSNMIDKDKWVINHLKTINNEKMNKCTYFNENKKGKRHK